MKARTRKRDFLDLLVYVAIGIAVAVGAILYGFHEASVPGGSPKLPMGWIGFAGETAIVFGYVLRGARRYWKRSRFWAGYLGFLAAHSVGCTIVLLRVDPFPLAWFIILGFAEFIALAYVLDLLLREPAKRDPRHRQEPS